VVYDNPSVRFWIIFLFWWKPSPIFLGTIKNRAVSVKHNLIYSLIIIRLETCFDLTESPSGLHYESINVKKLRTSLGWHAINLMEAIPMCLGTIKIEIVSVEHNLIYSLIFIRLATCFDPTESPSGLHYESINVRKLRTFLGWHAINLMEAIPMCLGTIKIEIVSVKHNLIYSLITVRLATCFDPVGSSSGLHYEPMNVKRLPI
jgi:hypothetical protein